MIYHAFWVNIETTCDVFSVFYYGLTHVSANKDNDREVYVHKRIYLKQARILGWSKRSYDQRKICVTIQLLNYLRSVLG